MRRLRAFLVRNWLPIVLAIIPPIVIWYLFQQERLRLQISLVADVPVITIDRQYADSIELRYRSRLITSLHIVDVTVRNAGNRPLERTAFDSPLAFLFAGTVLAPPTLLRATPPDLAPSLTLAAPDTVILAPLLLNGADAFTMRAYLADRRQGMPPLTVKGRVRGVRSLRVQQAGDADGRRRFLLGVAAALGAVLSLSSLVYLLRRAKFVFNAEGVPALTVDLAEAFKKQPTASREVAELAHRLRIDGHTVKSNLLLLRLKIESQLRQLARDRALPDRWQTTSISKLAHGLSERRIIPTQVASAVRDIYPLISRELHEIQTVLTDAEFEKIQELALYVVAALDSASRRPSPDELREFEIDLLNGGA